jgi:hypothetical protein
MLVMFVTVLARRNRTGVMLLHLAMVVLNPSVAIMRFVMVIITPWRIPVGWRSRISIGWGISVIWGISVGRRRGVSIGFRLRVVPMSAVKACLR